MYHIPYISINVCVCNIIYAFCSRAVVLEYGHFRFPVLNGPLELPPVVVAGVGTRLDFRIQTLVRDGAAPAPVSRCSTLSVCLSVQAYSQMQ